MTLAEQVSHFKEMTSKMETILLKKGNDYANEDRLSNFKLAGSICGLTAEQSCLSLIATKVARLGNLLGSGKRPDNESIQDSVLDLANYSILLSMIIDNNKVGAYDVKLQGDRVKENIWGDTEWLDNEQEIDLRKSL